MKSYFEATPATRLFNNELDLDFARSGYTNIRFSVPVSQLVTITAKYVANLPGLAYDFYGDMDMWRIILAFNGLQDPISDIQVGVVIGLPDLSAVQHYLSATSQKSNAVTLSI
jgi:hypothetical protein